MKIRFFLLLATLTALSLAGSTVEASAKKTSFSTSYISFDLDSSWQCQQSKEVYTCSPSRGTALIVIAAKIPGKEDNVKAYYQYLEKPKMRKDPNGKPFTSQLKLIKSKDIDGVKWVDAIHLSSEVPNYFTRYLGTVHNGVAILVTYSVAKEEQMRFAPVLLDMAKSIKVIAKAPTDKVAPMKDVKDMSALEDEGAPKEEGNRKTASDKH